MRAKIVEILNQIKTDIEANIDASGVSATGKSRNSLRIVEYDKGVKLVSSFKYFAVLEAGRRPGKMPPTKPIEDWIYARGLQKETDAKTRGFAFAIARKIGKEGYGRPTPPHKGFGSTTSNIYSNVLAAYIPILKKEIVSTIKLNK
ncbi:hypothetical protein EOM82_09830 [bacterium]|nr:hypothetical protein [bacterium]